MTDFQTLTTSSSTTAPDPHKHVKYSLGMVLGADDFDQEFAYLSNRDQWLARDAIGYGTVCGLQVKIETDLRGPRVEVSTGVAIDPHGQLIRVTPAQCAYINDWLAAHRDEVTRQTSSPPSSQLPLYLKLCYRECPVDPVPIPGEPCRDESEATVDSRIQDDFELKLSFNAPGQLEEDMLRAFVDWLSQVEIAAGETSVSLDEFIQAIRDAANTVSSPPSSPPLMTFDSPPTALKINTDDACEYLRAAFRIWVTELRGRWHGPGCDFPDSGDNCVLLAQVNVPLVDGQADVMTSENIDEEHRPYLIDLRMLQEWMVCGRGVPTPGDTVVAETSFGQAQQAGISASFSRADHTHGTPDLPAIPKPSPKVVSETAFSQAADAGKSTTYSRGDHTHGTPDLPAVPQPGTDVAAETTFGLASAPGAAATFSRSDHTHGTPALPAVPKPGTTVVTETAFGQASSPGTSALYSRADHTHGTPATGQTTGDFVEHAAGQPRYSIEAAGIARGDQTNPTPEFTPNYNKLFIELLDPSRIIVHFGSYEVPKKKHQYIIKAMPVFETEFWTKNKILQPSANFERYDDRGIVLFVTNLGRPFDVPDTLKQLAWVIEVSRYSA